MIVPEANNVNWHGRQVTNRFEWPTRPVGEPLPGAATKYVAVLIALVVTMAIADSRKIRAAGGVDQNQYSEVRSRPHACGRMLQGIVSH